MGVKTNRHGYIKRKGGRKQCRSSPLSLPEATKSYNLRSKRVKKIVQATISKQNDDARQDGICYLPLDQQRDEIRVLILEPGGDQDELCCTLETYQLDNCREFEALSYAWGDPKPVGRIFVNGSRTLVARNLSIALRYLRYTHSSRVLWVDAVCINQTDTPERNHQVFMMGRVYSTASLVLVWLGEAQGSTDFVMDKCKELGEGKEVADITKTGLKKLLYGCLMNRDWWSRLWVVQEIVLAKSDPIIICGSRCVSWDLFKKGCDAVGFGIFNVRAEKAHVKIWRQFQALCELRQSYRKATFGISLRSALAYTKDFQVADPRDTIYGCLGLVRMSEREIIRPDYQKSTELLFLETTKLILEQGSGKFYSTFSISKKVGTLSRTSPSWVPDFSAQEIVSFSIPAWGTTNKSKSIPCPGQRCVLFQDRNKVLAISGLFFDSIEVAIELKSNQALLLDQIPELDRLMQYAFHKNMPLNYSRYYLSKLKKQEDLFSVLGTGMEVPKLRHQYEVLAGLAELSVEEAMYTDFGARLKSLMNVVLPGRRFFVTSMGFVGIAVAKVRKNDSVTFLFGEHPPIILRPRGSSYAMVGAAYISGVMDGEVTGDIYQSGLIEKTTFLIR